MQDGIGGVVRVEVLVHRSSNGIVLTGGGALLRGLDRLLREQTDFTNTVSDDLLRSASRAAIPLES
jgi:actin-like ATPase involved in cell morphogenesis